MVYLFTKKTIIVYAFLIALLSFIPIKAYSEAPPFQYSTFFHGLAYFLLSFLVVNTLVLKKRKSCRLQSFIYSFCYGLIIEVVQFFLPFRFFEANDIFANFIGAFLGSLIKII